MRKYFTVDFHTNRDMDSLDNVTFHTLHACSKDNMMDMAAIHRLSARVLTHVLLLLSRDHIKYIISLL